MSALTLLLRVSGPLQSWGTHSQFSQRDTGLEPSKSGVIGLLCAALGRPREASVADLVTLRMGVRVDHEGAVQVDYHTVGGNPPGRASSYGVAEFNVGGVRTVVSHRAYLADANFLVGLTTSSPADPSDPFDAHDAHDAHDAGDLDTHEGPDDPEGAERERRQQELLRQLDRALARPVWPLFLGRKSFPPGEPVRLPDQPPLGPGLRPLPLREALLTYPWPSRASSRAHSTAAGSEEAASALRFVFDDPSASPGGEVRYDVPLSFAPLDRRYAPRVVRTEFHTRPATTPVRTDERTSMQST